MHGKRCVVVGSLALSLILSGCGTALRINQDRPAGIPTATPGSGPKGPEIPGPVETAGPIVSDLPTPDPVAVITPEQAAPPQLAEAAPAPTEAAPAPTEPPAPPPPAAAPTVNPALANVQLPTTADLQERWRQMQVERTPFEAPRPYVSPSYQIVWWFDPLLGQMVQLGEIRGEFTAQATFRIRGSWIPALEIPYHVNQEYGLTVPDPILQRMQAAGVGEWAEVFVYQTQDIQPK